MFLNYNGVKLQISIRKIWEILRHRKLNNTLPISLWIKEIQGNLQNIQTEWKLKKMYHKWWDAAMTIFRGTFIIIYAYIRKEEFQINDLSFQPIKFILRNWTRTANLTSNKQKK